MHRQFPGGVPPPSISFSKQIMLQKIFLSQNYMGTGSFPAECLRSQFRFQNESCCERYFFPKLYGHKKLASGAALRMTFLFCSVQKQHHSSSGLRVSPSRISLRIFFSALARGIISSCPQPRQRRRKSIPILSTRKRLSFPQGCGFFISNISFILTSINVPRSSDNISFSFSGRKNGHIKKQDRRERLRKSSVRSRTGAGNGNRTRPLSLGS